jgi:hypothetical protein
MCCFSPGFHCPERNWQSCLVKALDGCIWPRVYKRVLGCSPNFPGSDRLEALHWWPLLLLSQLAVSSCSLFQLPSQGFPPLLYRHGERDLHPGSQVRGLIYSMEGIFHLTRRNSTWLQRGENVLPYISIHGVRGHYCFCFFTIPPFHLVTGVTITSLSPPRRDQISAQGALIWTLSSPLSTSFITAFRIQEPQLDQTLSDIIFFTHLYRPFVTA